MRAWLAVAVALHLGGCAAPDSARTESDADVDASASPLDAATAWIEVGTGGPGEFIPFAEGAELLLQRGCQGSQHVLTSVRAFGVADGSLVVSVELVRVRDEALVSIELRVRLGFDEVNDAGARQVTGLTPVVADPRDVLDEEIAIRVQVQDAAGASVELERRARVRWGPDDCNPHG